ncbi:beta-ketoacyl-[acyl-carrier-protein] synthase family protein [Aliamphritea spongicola]|uniref:beta-ketoacyl-[acyl-carrier-protein] synthase family protein n=1 Tax=Aliamphritea spongicola TaxID=707589 RepID=UPI00196ACED5|nr:beta-ketoacyl-[acyl-carrier-protein] synthase family protein [Aliamphritea spongicola]MBN3564430.1 beta-ketoacyl-[acyl-carrier-protein] synthase family protein [Aliamphritea spongicola]
MKQPCYLSDMGIICAAGNSAGEVLQALSDGGDYLVSREGFGVSESQMLGLCEGELPDIPLSETRWQTRNNQLALAALNQIRPSVDRFIERYGAHRIGVVIGTSTSGISEGEQAIRQWVQESKIPSAYDYKMQEMGAPADFVATLLKTDGPVYGISTACSSGAKALATARRLIRAGVCDAVIAGGVDSICRLTVQGFNSLEAVSTEVCNPFSANRKGINIGEGGALFVVSNEPEGAELCGVGEGSDAHHISAPDPTGQGAAGSMLEALKDAGLTAADIDYVNLHGTATALNDQMEAVAVHQVCGAETPCSSTKPFTGHTLGAAGAIEAAICWLLTAKQSNVLPVHKWDGVPDPDLPPVNLVDTRNESAVPKQYVLSNSFAFGGNNISLIFGRVT